VAIGDIVKIKRVLIVIALLIGVVVLLGLGALCFNALGTQDADSTVFWRCLVGTLFVLVLGVCLEWGEKTIRIAGFAFQAFVIVVTGVAINGVRTRLDQPGVIPALAATAERPFKSDSGAPGGEGSAWVWSADDSTMATGTLTVHHNNLSTEDRFNVLEDQLAKVEAMAGRDNLLLKKEMRDNRNEVAIRYQAQVAATKALRELIVELMTGGLPLAFFGLVWLFIGAVLSSFPNEIETGIKYLHSRRGAALVSEREHG
jgi:hypothetical protein